MKNVKKLNEEPAAFRELPDESLDAVAGGDFNHVARKSTPVGFDSRGNTTHWQFPDGNIYHYVCPKCGRLLHEGTLGLCYCDPCDEWFSSAKIGSAVKVKGWYGE